MSGAAGWEYWTTYRKVPVFKRERGRSSDGRIKYEYYAMVKDVELVTWSQQAMRIQIGRVMNGLSPSDCNICLHHVPVTCMRDEYCLAACKHTIEENKGGPCPRFEVRA